MPADVQAEALPPSFSLRSALEEKARAAGIGTAFITPSWWAQVRALNTRDGIGPDVIAKAFEVCLETNIGKVHFFASDFAKYVQAAAFALVGWRPPLHSDSIPAATPGPWTLQEDIDRILTQQAASGSAFARDMLSKKGKL